MKAGFLFRLLRLVDSRAFWLTSAIPLQVLAFIKASPRWTTLAGYARERLGNIRSARSLYRRSVDLVRASDNTASLRWLHASQFFLSRAAYMLGEPSEDDPLFRCRTTHVTDGDVPTDNSNHAPIGYFKAEFIFSGMQIMGILQKGTATSVDLLLDGQKIRDVNVTQGRLWNSFSFKTTRRALRLFPKEALLTVATKDGSPINLFSGERGLRLCIPHGVEDSSPLVTGERKVDKKGVPVPSASELERDRETFLAIYADASAFFQERFDKHLFLAYGTLLGFHRQGCFIEGDDDFDAGFMAQASDALGVKREVLAMIQELVAVGFSVSFNRRGRLFRLHQKGMGVQGAHIDVHSFWVQDGKVFAHNDFCAPGLRGDYVPAVEGNLQGIKVYTPARTEAFLLAHYGPGWKTPDPGFVNYFEAADPAVLKNLSAALITPKEYGIARRLTDELGKASSSVGEFVSIGSRDLYPLTGRDEDLE